MVFNLVKKNYPYYWLKKSNVKNNNTPILFIHGFADNPKWFFPIFENINDRDIYCVELPGHYETPLIDKKQLSPTNLANEVIDLIKKINLKKIILMGHSMGGGIASIVTSRTKELVEKLILVTPMNYRGCLLFEAINFMFKFSPKSKKGVYRFYNVLVNKKNVRQLATLTSQALINNFKSHRKIYKTLGRNMASLKNLRILKKAEKEIKCPLLLIVGKHDGCINPKSTTKWFNKNVKNAQIITFLESGHMPFFEERNNFLQTILNFINQN